MKKKLLWMLLLLTIGAGHAAAQEDYWMQQTDFAGGARYGAVGICIGDKCYAGLGKDDAGNHYQDFWEFNPATHTWIRKADFPGGARVAGTAFAIGNKGYVGTGVYSVGDVDWIWYNDLWEYDPTTDTWTQKASFAEKGRDNAVSFTIGNKGYIGTGTYRFNRFVDAIYLNDFWEYDPGN